jgi:hypothetical protein
MNQISRNEVNQKPVILKLEGGLGNQLFQFAAGYFLASKINAPLQLDQYSIPLTTFYGERSAGFDQFEISPINGFQHHESMQQFPSPITVRLSKRFSIVKRVFLKTRMLTSNKLRVPLYAEKNENPELLDFYQINVPVKLHGNFQSWKLVERAALYGFPRILKLKNTPTWIDDLASANKLGGSLVLHLRVDKVARSNVSFQQPTLEYYLSAINKARDVKTFNDLYVLSDDIAHARALFGEKLPLETKFLEMPAKASPAERLYVMSLFGGIICANSTFCGWAAWSIHNSGGLVIVPLPYSDGNVPGSRDFPNSWIKLDKISGEPVG